MGPGARQEFAPEAGLGHWGPAALYSCKCLPLVPSAPPCCDGGHAEQGESLTRCWAQKSGQQGQTVAPHPLQPPILPQPGLPTGCRAATDASHHTAGSLLAQGGSVRRDGEPEPCGVRGAGNLLWCVPASAEPKQETTTARDCCGQRHSSGGLGRHCSSGVATPTSQKIQLATGKQDRAVKAPQPHMGPQGRGSGHSTAGPWVAQPGLP